MRHFQIVPILTTQGSFDKLKRVCCIFATDPFSLFVAIRNHRRILKDLTDHLP